MSVEQQLLTRSNHSCELCAATDSLAIHAVAPHNGDQAEHCVLLCATCRNELTAPQDQNHWRCLNDSMWNTEPAVQVLAWRTLKQLSTEVWAQDLLDMMYLEPEVQAWVEAGVADEEEDDSEVLLDSNGVRLQAGDSVTIIKDLDVKGAGFTAKRGTLVKNIGLNASLPGHIMGRVNGMQIQLVAAFLKKV
ncbi:PhnA domain-containing protein [Oceanisphaera pacifica]|uniref:PhnA domain-containing protein n=1 Tax=Oceanisphaera pacifica TaxID=2818389 RepID=A0ABS3NIK8_9GAMM|nr:alkylphosphonate utilization protein [Oceanisphaera pacifica]MBO1520414.1 PhnA domain-containing protein [Oceanisphaera pacifica]